LDPHAAKHSTPDENLVNSNNKVGIKRISKAQYDNSKVIVITKCLCEPCPRFYTDTISESIFVECRDPRHTCRVEVSCKND
jgi:hypothetical protein